MRIKLGAKVRDIVTEFEGRATTVADHLTGCRRFWVEAPANEKGDLVGHWVDEARLAVVDGPLVLHEEEVAARPAPADVSAPRQYPRP
jgi:hypothetical protein